MMICYRVELTRRVAETVLRAVCVQKRRKRKDGIWEGRISHREDGTYCG